MIFGDPLRSSGSPRICGGGIKTRLSVQKIVRYLYYCTGTLLSQQEVFSFTIVKKITIVVLYSRIHYNICALAREFEMLHMQIVLKYRLRAFIPKEFFHGISAGVVLETKLPSFLKRSEKLS